MITFPGCKLNVGLFVTGKREDGFHDLESIFIPVPWQDVLEVKQVDEPQDEGITVYGMPWDDDYRQNLVWKAYELLRNEFQLPSVHFYLIKQLPTGGGLGGGSSNGTAALVLLNDFFQLGLREEELENKAAQLGSDCPFFVRNSICRVSGRGEVLSPYSLELLDYYLVIIHPGIHVSTAQAFSGIQPQSAPFDLDQLNTLPLAEWKKVIRNDFESTIFPQFPEIERIKTALYDLGASYASMTGTGSSVFGFFKNPIELPEKLSEYKHWKGWYS